jgi:endonuclease YncB( thermonuclease family)
MRLYLSAQIGLWYLLLNVVASGGHTALGVWEELDGCRLVSAAINDGDSFKVKHTDKTFIVRLYFVDCPETYDTYIDRVRDQARYFSIAEDAVIAAGKRATAFTQKFLQGEFTIITQWADARGGKEPRFFALVRKNNRLLSSELVRAGHARIYGMPTQGSWPNGATPQNYLRQLKHYERAAQRESMGIWSRATHSPQLAALKQLNLDIEGTEANLPATASFSVKTTSRTGKLILNTASATELETLPGIGPALAAYIIAARPIACVDDLVNIPGITMTKIDTFRAHVLTDEPPPAVKTANFYLADPQVYLNKDATVVVATVAQSNLTAPEGFRSVSLQTANEGQAGGSIPAFVPNELFDSFMEYYQISGRAFTGLLFQYDSDIVLVYPRK